MDKLTIVFCLLAIASELVNCHPSGSFSIQYYGDSEKADPAPRAARTTLKILPKPDHSGVRKNRGSITYFSEFGPPSTGNDLIKEVYPVPQGGFVPIVKSRGQSRYNQVAPAVTKVTKIQPVARTFDSTVIKPVVEDQEPATDPVKLSLAASPLRLLPVDPPSFNTIRNEVQAIKAKNNKYFGESNFVDEYAQEPISIKVEAPQLPVALVPPVSAPATPLQPSVHYNFEQSFGDTKWPIHKKASPIKKKAATIAKSAYTIDGISDRKLTIDKLAKLDKYRLKSAESGSDESDSNSDSNSSSSEEDGTSSSSEEDSSEEAGFKPESSNESQKESPKDDEFPVNFYAQTRHEKSRAYLPAPQNDPRISEKISTKKTNIVYSEQGYNDKDYDHGKSTKLYEVHQRYRRDLTDQPSKAIEDDEEIVEEIEALPIPLALQQQVNGSNLNGEELLAYVQEVIKNSSKFLPEDINDDVDNSFTSLLLNSAEIKKLFALPNELPNASEPIAEGTESVTSSEKYPFLHLPESDAISKTSALRYAEHPGKLPKSGRSYYETKNTKDCDEIEPEIDPVPPAIQNGDTNQESPDTQTETKHNKKRLKGLDKKIKCLKKKQFGEDPLDNPLFKEEFVNSDGLLSSDQNTSKATAFKPTSIEHPSNPSINVYDDVISNIRLAIVAENANLKDRNRVEILKLKSKALDVESSESSNVNQTVSVGIPIQQPEDSTKDGIFDISKYLPRIYYEPKDGVLYRVRYKKKRRKKKKSNANKSRNIRHNPKYSDYTVFPRLEDETKPDYFNRESKFNYNNDVAADAPIRSNKILHAPSNHHPKALPHPIHSLSSGYYPYPVLAVRRKRFHYELIGNPE